MRRATVFALLLAATGCADPTGPLTVAGAYELESVNGGALPFRMVDNPDVAIVSRRIVLDEDGAFSDRYELRVEVGSERVPLAVARSGRYSGGPGPLVLTYPSGRTTRAVVGGGTLELDDRGVRFRLRR